MRLIVFEFAEPPPNGFHRASAPLFECPQLRNNELYDHFIEVDQFMDSEAVRSEVGEMRIEGWNHL
jgi:hypothetical protein